MGTHITAENLDPRILFLGGVKLFRSRSPVYLFSGAVRDGCGIWYKCQTASSIILCTSHLLHRVIVYLASTFKAFILVTTCPLFIFA